MKFKKKYVFKCQIEVVFYYNRLGEHVNYVTQREKAQGLPKPSVQWCKPHPISNKDICVLFHLLPILTFAYLAWRGVVLLHTPEKAGGSYPTECRKLPYAVLEKHCDWATP